MAPSIPQYSPPIHGFVLAGGLSTRMGTDKSTLTHAGKSFVDNALELLIKLGLQAVTVSNDLRPGRGPLGGIETAFLQHPCEAGLFLPCDMPLLELETLQSLLSTYRQSRCPVVLKVSGQRPGFPFILPSNVLPQVTRQLDKNEFSLQKLFVELQPVYIEAVDSQSLMNVNTPLDYQVISNVQKS